MPMVARSREFVKGIFSQYYDVDDSGCWMWKARQKDQWDYGRISIEGKRDWSHRWSFRLFKREIEKGEFILHSCHKPGCVNPEHLRAGTPKQNMLDMTNDGRRGTIHGKFNKDYCPHGHRMDEKNTYINPNRNKRKCRKCSYISTRAWVLKKRKESK